LECHFWEFFLFFSCTQIPGGLCCALHGKTTRFVAVKASTPKQYFVFCSSFITFKPRYNKVTILNPFKVYQAACVRSEGQHSCGCSFLRRSQVDEPLKNGLGFRIDG
jgi:hypothetical protein